MDKEVLQQKIRDVLKRMGCSDITFSNGEENKLIVRFNCIILLSFKIDAAEWSYSGIQLNDSGSQKYMIIFKKNNEPPKVHYNP